MPRHPSRPRAWRDQIGTDVKAARIATRSLDADRDSSNRSPAHTTPALRRVVPCRSLRPPTAMCRQSDGQQAVGCRPPRHREPRMPASPDHSAPPHSDRGLGIDPTTDMPGASAGGTRGPESRSGRTRRRERAAVILALVGLVILMVIVTVEVLDMATGGDPGTRMTGIGTIVGTALAACGVVFPLIELLSPARDGSEAAPSAPNDPVLREEVTIVIHLGGVTSADLTTGLEMQLRIGTVDQSEAAAATSEDAGRPQHPEAVRRRFWNRSRRISSGDG